LALGTGHLEIKARQGIRSENGFTMIETVSVVGLVGIVGVMISLLLFQLFTSHSRTIGWVDSQSNTARALRQILYGSLSDGIIGVASATSIEQLRSTSFECVLMYSVGEETIILYWSKATGNLSYNGKVLLRDVTQCDLVLDTDEERPLLSINIQVGTSSASKRAVTVNAAVKLRNM
jgi:hypothetical protein